ncbi:MAG: hypothetical protein HGA90_06255 [Alphaproteobacteria bacterium]|nr:hypothetical protein [Alphaproteobacteria bacterium]
MPQKTRKVHIVCRRCKTRFTGAYCPYCGAEKGTPRVLGGRGGLLGGLLRFLLSLAVLALILTVTFICLDYSASAQGDRHGAARAILRFAEEGCGRGAGGSDRTDTARNFFDVYAWIGRYGHTVVLPWI